MTAAENKKNQKVMPLERSHPFGGCNKILGQYAIIGHELLRYDRSIYQYGYGTSYEFTDFREGVASVPVEVLESYLEDLLDLEVSEEKLFIDRNRFGFLSHYIALGGLLCAMGVGLYAASNGASLLLSFALTVSLSLPFGVLWHFSPRDGLIRRVSFAQIVSHEVSRRRGGDKDFDRRSTSATVLELLGRKTTGSAQGAARMIFH